MMTIINSLPAGTRFYVNNGNWHGAIAVIDGKKHVYVFETKKYHLVVGDVELDIDLESEV